MPLALGTVLGLISLISTLTGGGIAVGKGIKQGKNEKKIKQHNEDVADYEEKMQSKKDKEARRAALARAIGATQEFSPKEAEKPPEQPDLDSTTGYDIAGGIANVVGGSAGAASGMADKLSAPSNAPASQTQGLRKQYSPMQDQGDFDMPNDNPFASSTDKYGKYGQKMFRNDIA